MKKTLSILAVLGIVSVAAYQSADAFSWSSLNPWSKCRCENKMKQCPCSTGYAAPSSPCETKAPCDPCEKIKKAAPCDACDRLQQEMGAKNSK